MKTSEELGDLATALSKAQGQIADAEKATDNPFFKSTYADLAEVLGQIRPIFSEHGLSLTQWPGLENEGWVSCTTRILHSSGQWMESTMSMPVQGKNVAQDSGSVLTYMRRYMAAAAAGIAQVDTDANQADKKSQSLSEPKPREDKPWYNTVEEDVDGIKGELTAGKSPKEILNNLRENFKVSRKTGDRIQEYADELNGVPAESDLNDDLTF